MNIPINDGGPAFPSGKSETQGYENSHPYYEGMTLRDWFAGHALSVPEINSYVKPSDVAELAYNLANAMIAERNKSLNIN
jgi:hypothetical protein